MMIVAESVVLEEEKMNSGKIPQAEPGGAGDHLGVQRGGNEISHP